MRRRRHGTPPPSMGEGQGGGGSPPTLVLPHKGGGDVRGDATGTGGAGPFDFPSTTLPSTTLPSTTLPSTTLRVNGMNTQGKQPRPTPAKTTCVMKNGTTAIYSAATGLIVLFQSGARGQVLPKPETWNPKPETRPLQNFPSLRQSIVRSKAIHRRRFVVRRFIHVRRAMNGATTNGRRSHCGVRLESHHCQAALTQAQMGPGASMSKKAERAMKGPKGM